MKSLVARHETVAFLLVTFGVSWPLWILSGILGRETVRAPDLRWLVAQIGVFAPSYAAMFVAAYVEPGARRRGLQALALVYAPAAVLGLLIATRGYGSFFRIGPLWSWAIVALGIWVLIWFARGANRLVPWPGGPASRSTVAQWSVGAAVVPTAALLLSWWLTKGGAGPSAAAAAEAQAGDLTALGLFDAAFVNLLYGGSLGEELGWRGVWLPRLLRTHSPGAASLILSFWWALWHAPIDITQGFGLPGLGSLLARQIWTLPLTMLFTWVTLRAGGNLLAPIAFHTAVNTFPDFAMRNPAHYSRAIGVFFVLTLVAAVALPWIDPRSWGNKATAAMEQDEHLTESVESGRNSRAKNSPEE